MSSTIRNAKQSVSIKDTAAERLSRLYVDVRASYGPGGYPSSASSKRGSFCRLARVSGNLAIAQQTKGLAGNFVTFKEAFVCFGIGVMLAASSSVVAFLIQNVAIAHPKDAEGKTGRRLGLVRIGMVVASLFLFAVGIAVAANAVGNLIGSLEMTVQRQTDLQRIPADYCRCHPSPVSPALACYSLIRRRRRR